MAERDYAHVARQEVREQAKNSTLQRKRKKYRDWERRKQKQNRKKKGQSWTFEISIQQLLAEDSNPRAGK
jgi:hypothetical protein